MKWFHIARTELEHAIRSRLIWGVTTLFVLAVSVMLYLTTSTFDSSTLVSVGGYLYLFLPTGDPTIAVLVNALVSVTSLIFSISWLGALIGLLVGYGAIVPERESGSIRTLLALPYSRRDIFIGKLVGRAVVCTFAVATGLVVAGIWIISSIGQPDVVSYLLFSGTTVVYCVAFLALGMLLSTAFDARRRVVVSVIGVYIFVILLWTELVRMFSLFPFGHVLHPIYAYNVVTASFFQNLESGAAINYATGGDGMGATISSTLVDPSYRASLLESLPFYLTDWFATLVLFGWLVVPAVLGYVIFERTDLT